MGRPFLWICCVSIAVALTGCQADHNLVQEESEVGYIDADGYAVGTPYWWRTHPYFAGKKVDEAATLAAGDPYLVIHAEDEHEPMHDKFIEALKDQYSREEVLHMLIHHRDVASSLNIPGVDMSLLDRELPEPPPTETINEHCTCPWEDPPPPGCDNDGGSGGPPPAPPLPPDPEVNSFMHIVGDYFWPDQLPASRSVRLYLSTISLNGILMLHSRLENIRVEKDAVPVYLNLLHIRNLTRVHGFHRTFSYGDARPIVWVSTADHVVKGLNHPTWEDESRATITF